MSQDQIYKEWLNKWEEYRCLRSQRRRTYQERLVHRMKCEQETFGLESKLGVDIHKFW